MSEEKKQSFKVGDRVSFTYIQHRGSTTVLHAYDGKVMAVEGDFLTIKKDKFGRLYKTHINRVRPVSADNELTEMIMRRGQYGISQDRNMTEEQ